MATSTNKRSELVIYCNSQQAEAQLKKWREQLKQSKKELRELAEAGKSDTDEFRKLNKEVKNLSKSIKANESDLHRIDNTLKDLSNASLRQVERAARDAKKALSRMSENDPNLKTMQGNLQKLNAQIQKLKGNTVAAGNGMASAWKKTAMAVTSYLGVTMMLGKVKQMMTDVINLNLKYSDQLADIRKVSGLTTQDINKLSNNLAKIDTRTSLQEMAQIGYAGAKLGMGKYGIEGLESFVNAANQVNVALKEDLGQDALTALSKMVEVMGLIPKMGVEQSLLATGSAMFKLASTSTADAGSIVEFSKRLTGMARAAGITTDQLLALGSASSSMALMPEVSATAFSKLITSLQTSHNLIEDSLHIEKGTISSLFEAGKLIDAIVLVFEKMHEMGNMNAIDPIFKDLGSDGARLKTVMVTMSQNVDMLKEHISTSAEAFENATDVTMEYNIQQETAQAYMERASHMWEKSFVNPEGVDTVKSLAQAWYDVSKSMTTNTVSMGLLKGTFAALLGTIKAVLYVLPALASAFMFRGVAAVFIGISAGLADIKRKADGAMLSVAGLTKAWHGLNAAQRANYITAIIALVASLAIYIADLAKKTGEATSYMNGFDKSLGNVHAKMEEVRSEATRYREAIDKANMGTKERAAAIKNFNDKFGAYYSNMLTEKSTAEDIAKAYDEVCKQLERKAVLEAKEEDIKKQYTPRVRWAAQRLYDYGEIAKGSGNGQYDANWLRGVIGDKNSTRSVVNAVAAKLGLNETDIATAMAYANSTSIPTQVFSHYEGPNKPTSGGGGGPSHTSTAKFRDLTPEQRMLIGAARSAAQMYSAQNSRKKIDEKYEPLADMLKEALVNPESNGLLENEKPDKDAIKEAQKAEQERKRQLREELKQAQDEARAVIDNIKNFYERQITQVLQTAKEQGWSEQLLQSTVDAITARQNLALSQARKGIAGVKSSWEDFKKTMRADMIEQKDEVDYNESEVLLDAINNSNLKALHDHISSLGRELGLPNNAATDAIWKNASLNEKANETTAWKRQRDRQKKLLEDNYTAKVDDQYSESMTQLGFFDVDEEQQKLLHDAKLGPEQKDAAQKMLDKRKAEIESVFANARKHYAELVQIADAGSEEGRSRMFELIFGENWDQESSQLKEVFDLSEKDLRLFYSELMKYSDDYTEALKKAHDRQKKLLNFQWERTDEYRANDDAQKRVAQISTGVAQFHRDNQESTGDDTAKVKPDLPVNGVYGGSAYMDSFSYDPEVEAYRLKMEAAAAYYDFLAAHGADAQTLREAEQSILQSEMEYAKSVAEQMKQRMDDIYELATPVEEFGTAMGEAFATMTEDSEAGRAAVKAAIGDMIKAFMKQTVQMTQEYIKRRIMQKANDRLASVQIKQTTKKEVNLEQSKQDQILDTQKVGGQAQEMLNTEVKTNIQQATAEIGQQTLQTQQANTQTEVQTESAKTQANTTMGIASGASKIIGSLGWWGIPLVAVITALLNGLLSMAMSKVSSLFGGGADSSDAGSPTKLVSGMLTYDSGNVQAFRGVEDGKTYPVVGDDGQVYAAKDGGELSTGLVKDPITTFVNGQPALVAERGPEMVIGRETTAAMMMARPDILAEIVKFDRARSGRTFRAFDGGNIDDYQINLSQGMSSEDVAELRTTISTLASVLATIQKNGIAATINKYGRGGVTEAAKSGSNFMTKNSGDRLWRG